ncbi:MAG: hypothetical protein JXA74_16260 [Anaerolineae bacterium]|nr:hypothetical protein [Anaerolineae bacterium]
MLFALLAGLLVWQGVAEAIEPMWSLALLHWVRPQRSAVEVAGPGDTTLRVYRDTSPHIGKVAGLQKGLIWTAEGQELVEEGYGLGCPLVVVGDQAYNAKRAEVSYEQAGEVSVIRKRFSMDTLDTPIRFLRRKYRRVTPLGSVLCTYRVHPDGVIDVEVDLGDLDASWTRLFMMNEAGATRFWHYSGGEGLDLEGEAIGIWRPMQANSGCMRSGDLSLGFCVEAGEGHTLYAGRERYWQYNWRGVFYLSWAGIDIEVAGPRDSYAYRVLLEAGP